MSEEKQERVKAVLRQVGYTDFTNVHFRHYPVDNNIIGIGGGNNSLFLIPPDFTASSNDSISSLYPSIPSHTLSSLTIGDVERQPDLRDQLMRDYGVFVKTTKECDHLLGFSGTQMYNDDGAKLMNVQVLALASAFFILQFVHARRNARKITARIYSSISSSVYIANKKIVDSVHEESLMQTLRKLGKDSAYAANDLSKAEMAYNLIVRKKREWFGSLFITSTGDDILFPPTSSKRLQLIDKYLQETGNVIS